MIAHEAKSPPGPPDVGGGHDLARDETEDAARKRPRIRCPRCAWRPRAHDRWQCYCGFVWNTFDTGGVCPDCGFTHLDTMCLACARWSKHAAWYAEEDDA